MQEVLQQIIDGFKAMSFIEFGGFIFGLLAVIFLIKEHIFTWPAGIIYCLLSFFVFWQAKLYQDFILHLFFLVMNIYGWYVWSTKGNKQEEVINISWSSKQFLARTALLSVVLILLSGFLFNRFTDTDVAYVDATTSILSISAMWMTAKKKIENWILWFIVDVVASALYAYKGLYFYSFLYLLYLGMAIAGYLNWLKLYKKQSHLA